MRILWPLPLWVLDRRQFLGLARFGGWDGLFVLLAGIQGILLLEFPSAPVIAAGLWWNANTISHNFIHRPFFRSRSSQS